MTPISRAFSRPVTREERKDTVMADTQPHPGGDEAHDSHESIGPTSYEEKQKDIGASLFFGGLVIIVLLAVLIWQGLF